MGNDGGSIPTRRELVKEAARQRTNAEVKESQYEQQEYHWTTDPVSHKPLARPVVSDSSGKLYNKETIVEYLVEGSRKEEAERTIQGAVRSLKDVVEVKFEVDEEATAKANREVWKCPVTGDKLGPGSKAAYLVSCGHAFSGSAIKELSGEKCLSCEMEYASNDIIPILPTVDTDLTRLSIRIKTLQERGLTHSLKKASKESKKRKKRDVAASDTGNGVTNGDYDAKEMPVKHAHGTPGAGGIPGIKNASTASLTAKVLEDQERAKKRKLENENVRSLFSSKGRSKPIDRSSDFT